MPEVLIPMDVREQRMLYTGSHVAGRSAQASTRRRSSSPRTRAATFAWT